MQLVTSTHIEARRELRNIIKEIPRTPMTEHRYMLSRLWSLAQTLKSGQDRRYVVDYLW